MDVYILICIYICLYIFVYVYLSFSLINANFVYTCDSEIFLFFFLLLHFVFLPKLYCLYFNSVCL